MAALVLGFVFAFTLAVPANAQSAGIGPVINVHYYACLSELDAIPGILVGLDGTCPPVASDSENWNIYIVNNNVEPVQFELINVHSGLCLSEDGLQVGVDTCNSSNGADLWQMTDPKDVDNLLVWRLVNVHYGLCLGANSLGIGGTGTNTCSSNDAAFWYLVGLD
jgi:Ricin-type beta-trefoil lectin domain-like